MDDVYHFSAPLEKFDSKLWTYHLKVPGAIAELFLAQRAKRVICVLHKSLEFQCAIMPKGDGVYFININKALRDKLGLRIGMSVSAAIRKDSSQFGLPMPEALAEVLRQDEDGQQYFQALTPGKQRTLLHIVGSVKSPDLQVHRAIVVVEHLKAQGGKIDYKKLNTALKAGR